MIDEIGPCLICHKKEPNQDRWEIGDKALIPHGIDWMTPAFAKRAKRLRMRAILNSLERRQSGLNHSINGHLNKHFLKMKAQLAGGLITAGSAGADSVDRLAFPPTRSFA